MTKEKWYQKTRVIILLIICLFPVGLYLMWKYTDWKREIKIAITSIIAFYMVLFAILPLLSNAELIATTNAFENSTTDIISRENDSYYEEEEEAEMVWIPNSGAKYHSYEGCSNMKNPSCVTVDEAISWGYTACSKCW